MNQVKVPFIDLKQRFQDEKNEILKVIDKVLTSGHLVMTEELAEFENKISSYTGSPYCLGLNSGTDALMMAMMAAGVKKGDEVITSPISFIATVGAIFHIGAKPVFVDTSDDMNISVDKIEQAITPKTKAIIPVHWIGRVCDMTKILKIAKKYNLIVIEDSAQSMGATYENKHGGTFGICGAISFHPLKNLNGLGDGGMLLTNNKEIYEKVKLYRNHGMEARDNYVEFGINSRLDILNSEILKFRLTKLDKVNANRRANANLYRKLITAEQVYIPSDDVKQKTSYVMFLVLCENRDKLKEYLSSKGIETLVYYGTPLHLHKASEKFGYKIGDFPIAENQCNKVLALPHHQYITESQIQFVSKQINEFYRKQKNFH